MPAGVSAYVPLANITLSSSTGTIYFDSISQSYRDLVVIASNVSLSSSNAFGIRFNNDTGNNYNRTFIQGNGSSVGVAQDINGSIANLSVNAFSSNGQVIINIMDYTATDKTKTLLSRYNNASSETTAVAAKWASTSAITSLYLTFFGSSALSGSTFALYGVTA